MFLEWFYLEKVLWFGIQLRGVLQLLRKAFCRLLKMGKQYYFWNDSWDLLSPILASFPSLKPLSVFFLKARWSKVADFKTSVRLGNSQKFQWKESSS